MKTLDLSQNLFCRAENLRRTDAYTGLLALYGLAQTAAELHSARLLRKCEQELSLYPDGFAHPAYNFECYRAGGNALAWLLWADRSGQVALTPEFRVKGRAVLAEYAEKTLHAPTDRAGILCMPRCPKKEQVWVDVITAVTPFMLYAGLTLDRPDYIAFGAEQCFRMIELFRDPVQNLLHQCRGFRADLAALSDDHWSRGNAWAYIGLADLVKDLPAQSMYRPRAELEFRTLSEALLTCQGADGMWRQELTVDSGWTESSGSALFLYGFGAGLRCKLLDARFSPAYLRGLHALTCDYIRPDLCTRSSCPGCLCPGTGADKGTIHAYLTAKQPQDDEPHSYGAFMLALAEAHRNGISDTEQLKECAR